MRKQWGSALGVSVLMLSIMTGLALAKVRPRAVVLMKSHLINPGWRITVSTQAHGLRGPLDFAYRVRASNGRQVALRRMAPTNGFIFKPPRPGTYWIQARVMTRSALKQKAWKHEVFSAPTAVYVGTSPALTLSAPSIPLGSTLSMTMSSQGVAHPQYEWAYRPLDGRWTFAGSYGSATQASLTLRKPGPYQAEVLVKTPHGPVITSQLVGFSVYGAPAAIKLALSHRLWVADGKETEMLTASVVDSQGDVVRNYSGTGTLMDQGAQGAISAWGSDLDRLTAVASGEKQPLTFTNGQARLFLQAGTVVTSDRLTATSSGANNQVLTGNTMVSTTAQVATALKLTTRDTYIIANESGNPATYRATVDDQVGEPMLSGTYSLTGAITGPGQFHNLTQGPDTVTYTGGAGSTPITVYSIAGSLGPMTLTLAGGGLARQAITIPAILGGQPYQMGVCAANTQLKNGESTPLTLTQLTKTGAVSDPASLDNSGYIVSITSANGNPATGFTLGGAPYTGTPMSFAVATGPNYFYAVSQPVTLTATNAAPGTYEITVADADGLWKTSNPLTITVTQ